MDTRPYATVDGIRTYLSSLQGLHALRADRLQAAQRMEWLPAFCVLGRHVLTENGRFGDLSGDSPRDLPDVATLDEVRERGRRQYGDGWKLSYRTPAFLAPCEGTCPECGNGWTFYQRSDVVDRQEWQGFLCGNLVVRVAYVRTRHAACHQAVLGREALSLAKEALRRAGYGEVEPEPCNPPSVGLGIWHRLATPKGPIRFGPNLRGYRIDWADTGVDLRGAFCRVVSASPFGPLWNEPPVDHGPFHVDPKDETWLVTYLRRLREALGS